MSTIEKWVAEAAARGLRLLNLFQRQDGSWQANVCWGFDPTAACCGWARAKTAAEALEIAIGAAGDTPPAPTRKELPPVTMGGVFE